MKTLLILCLALVGLAGFASVNATAAETTTASVHERYTAAHARPAYYHHRHHHHHHHHHRYHRHVYYRHGRRHVVYRRY